MGHHPDSGAFFLLVLYHSGYNAVSLCAFPGVMLIFCRGFVHSAIPLPHQTSFCQLGISFPLFEEEEKVVLGSTALSVSSPERLPVLGPWEPGNGNSPGVIDLQAPAVLLSSKPCLCMFILGQEYIGNREGMEEEARFFFSGKRIGICILFSISFYY